MFSSICQRVILFNLLDTKVNPNCLLFSQRERQRERESPKSNHERGRVVGWCDGAGYYFQCRGVLLIWIIVGQGPIALAVGGVVWTFFSLVSRLSFLFSFSLFRRLFDRN